MADAPSRAAVAEDVFAKLVAGESAEIPDLGEIMIREYKAYEGRNPRTGETVSVPRKRLPFFMTNAALREHFNGGGRAPTTPWVAAMVADMTSNPVVFGRVGVFGVVRKEEAAARDPSTGSEVVIPQRTIVTFRPSRQLKRRLNEQPEPKITESASVDEMLARLPTNLPRTLAQLDTALGRLGISHRVAGLVEPAQREVDDEIVLTVDSDDEPVWYREGRSAVRRDLEDEVKFPIARWAGDMLVVAAVRSVASEGMLSEDAIARVLARLGSDGPFSVSDLPY